MTTHTYPDSLCQRMRELAARPQGVSAQDLRDLPPTARATLYALAHTGQVHPSRAPTGRTILRWYTCPQAAQAHQDEQAALRQQHAVTRTPKPPREPRPSKAPASAAPRLTAAQKWAAAPVVVPPGVRITYASPPQGRLAGLCPPDRPPVLRDGATDYKRHMARYRMDAA